MSLFEFRRNWPFRLDSLEDCANAIDACRDAMPSQGFTKALRENAIPINELSGYQCVGQTLNDAMERIQRIMDNTRAAVMTSRKK